MKSLIYLTLLFATMLSGCAMSHHPAEAPRVGISTWAPKVMTGLDVLEREGFASLKGQRVGLITNHSGINAKGIQNIDLMVDAGVNLVALFSPEHGIRGEVDTKVDSSRDEKTGLEIHSLYGKTRRPTEEMLEGIDVLVFDIQDIGARFYTYIGTLGNCMEEAARLGIKVVVLDRPNPIRADWYDGPIQDEDLVGRFTSYRSMPTVHGMTVGELALYFNKYAGGSDFTNGIGADLTVVPMESDQNISSMYFDEMGLPWVNPSPNMRSVDEELIYTMIAQTEGNKIVSVGRGTDRPFEYLGAPWIDGEAFTQAFRERNLPGVWFMKTTFVPSGTDVSGRKNYPYQYIDEVCNGIRVMVTDRHAISPVEAGIHMLDILLTMYPEKYDTDDLRGLVGSKVVLDEVNAGIAPEEIARRWRNTPEFILFEIQRESVMLYER